jgi:hypothetical protein
LQVLLAALSQPQLQQLDPQNTPTRQVGWHSLPFTHPAWQQKSPHICSGSQHMPPEPGKGFPHFCSPEQHVPLHEIGVRPFLIGLQQMPSVEQTLPSAQQTPWQTLRSAAQQTPSLQICPGEQQAEPQQMPPGEQH